jgi:signal transduction histidine kinase
MHIENIIVIITGIITLSIPVYLLIDNYHSKVNRIYSLATIFSGPLWALSIALFRESANYNTALFWDKSLYTIVTFVGLLFHLFSYNFPRARKFWSISSLLLIVVAIGLIYSILFTNQFVTGIEINNQGNKAFLGPAYIVWVVWILSIFTVDSIMMLRDYTLLGEIEKRQLKYITIGVIVPSFGVMPTNALLPIIGIYNYIWIGPLFMLLMNLIIAYGISRRRFLNLDSVIYYIFKILLYALTISLSYQLIEYINLIYLNAKNIIEWRTFFIFIIFVPTLFLTSKVDNIFKKIIQKNKYYAFYLVEDLSKKLSTQLDLNKISSLILKQLFKIFNINNTFLVIVDKDISSIIFSQSTTSQNLDIKDITYINDVGAKYFEDNSPIILSEIEYTLVNQIGEPSLNESHQKEKLIEIMYKYKVELIYNIPLKSENFVYLLIGQKDNHDIFVNSEIGIIKSMINNISIAISRAFLYIKVQKFNDELQSQIAQATKELTKQNVKLGVMNVKLKDLDSAKSDFISIASHQLRTPLSIIKGYLSMLSEGDYGKVNSEQVKVMNMTFSAVGDLEEVVNELLTSSRIEKGKFTITKTPNDIIELIDYVKRLYSDKYAQKELYLKIHYPKGLKKLVIDFDKEKFHQVIVNLIENAFNYTPKGGVTLTLDNNKTNILLSVKDTGIGIPEEGKKKLFERFSRLENAQDIRPDGTGIGLFTAKIITEKHDGKIWFESELNKGTTFFVELPKK